MDLGKGGAAKTVTWKAPTDGDDEGLDLGKGGVTKTLMWTTPIDDDHGGSGEG